MSSEPSTGGSVVVVAPSDRTAARLCNALARDGFRVAQVVVAPVPAATVSALAPGEASEPPGAAEWRKRLADLSPREMEVLQQLVDGTSRSEAAANLFITENTVRAHVRRVLAKTGARSSLEAVSIAARAGMRPGGA